MTFQNFAIKLTETQNVNCIKFVPKVSNSDWIIYLHELPGGPLDQIKDLLYEFGKLNIASVTFNYPGLWHSPGVFYINDIKKVIDGIFSHLKDHRPNRIFLFGGSFGGLVAINVLALQQYPVNKVILRSPLLDLRPILGFLPSTLEYLYDSGVLNSDYQIILDNVEEINPPNHLEKIEQIPIWGVIGKNDEVLPAEQMVNVVDGYSNIDVELWDDFPHNMIDSDKWDLFLKKMVNFLNK